MASLFDGFAKQVLSGDTIKDWAHASKIFVDGNYARAPKYGFLYHVQLEVNSSLIGPNSNTNLNLNLMVKSITLPKYKVDSKVLNAYGQPYVVQNHLGYDPVTITFHDDSSDVVRQFWNRYQTFYYASNRESNFNSTTSGTASANRTFSSRDIYRTSESFDSRRGFDVKAPYQYLRSIRVFSFSNKQFSSFMLVNPIINSFAFGDHRAAEGNTTLEATMAVDYEAVIYQPTTQNYQDAGNDRLATALDQAGFTKGPYDQSPSPLVPEGGGTQSLFGQGGIIESGQDILGDLAAGRLGEAAFKAGRVLQTNQGVDLKRLAKTEGTQILREGIKAGLSTKNSSIYLPTLSGTVTGKGSKS